MSPDLRTRPQTQIPRETSKTENEEANETPPIFELGYKPHLVFCCHLFGFNSYGVFRGMGFGDFGGSWSFVVWGEGQSFSFPLGWGK